MIVVLALLAVHLPVSVQARELAAAVPAERQLPLRAYFERIQGLDFDYGKVGSVLEAIAFAALSEELKADGKRVLHSIQYFDAAGRTLGELDIVVIDGDSSAVVAVYEVKLSGNPRRAAAFGRRQIARFRKHLAEDVIARMEPEHPQDARLEVKHFAECKAFGMIGSRGAVVAGFDREFDLARDEADVLQDWLLKRKASP